METKKINLEEILQAYKSLSSFHPVPDHFIVLAMKEACRQTLELASENALMDVSSKGEETWTTDFYCGPVDDLSINKNSITDTINQID